MATIAQLRKQNAALKEQVKDATTSYVLPPRDWLVKYSRTTETGADFPENAGRGNSGGASTIFTPLKVGLTLGGIVGGAWWYIRNKGA